MCEIFIKKIVPCKSIHTNARILYVSKCNWKINLLLRELTDNISYTELLLMRKHKILKHYSKNVSLIAVTPLWATDDSNSHFVSMKLSKSYNIHRRYKNNTIFKIYFHIAYSLWILWMDETVSLLYCFQRNCFVLRDRIEFFS